ncbi:MAG: VRR-NUC domain-containing protein [Spirosomataceae bacterium]
MENDVLPPTYYHTNFCYLLSFVQEKYKSILQAHEWRFLRKFYCLTEEAQCLFVRLSNRRGLYFRVDSLQYQELSTIPESIKELEKQGFISYLTSDFDSVETPLVLRILAKEELKKIFKLKGKASLRKDEYIQAILAEYPEKEIIQAVAVYTSIIRASFQPEIAFLKFLFFGNRSMDMTEFVLRDLGILSYQSYKQDELVARFSTRKEAEDKWFVSDQFEIFYQLTHDNSPVELLFDWISAVWDSSFGQLEELAARSMERLVLKVALYLERKKALDLSLILFEKVAQPPARERRVRILEKQKEWEAALAICEEIIAQPAHEEELIFANDRIAKREKKRLIVKTQVLKDAPIVTISAEYKGNVEMGVAHYYESLGYQAIFTENHLWRGLFGLVFWDIIFDKTLVVFHHPFQRRPSDFHLPDFYEKRKVKIKARLDALQEPALLIQEMAAVYQEKMGIENPFVIWNDAIWEMCRLAVAQIPLQILKTIWLKIAENHVENGRGFPDLMVRNEEKIFFVEVKSPTDHLSNQQVFWQSYFRENGLEAIVLRVDFK